MQLGKAIVGAIIGAALGIGALIAIYLASGIDHVALAIVVALLTGLGVRMLVSTSGHASYARGALTGLLALAAYVGGWFLVAEIAKARAATTAKRPAAVAKAEVKDEADASTATGEGEATTVEIPDPVQRPQAGPAQPKAQPGQNPLDYVWLAIAALVAYELGRGSSTKPVGAEEVIVETPEGTHPDA